MSNLDELRQRALYADEDPFENFEESSVKAREVDDGKIFGMTAVERMFVSIGIFLAVTVLSFLLLVLTSSISL